jgi:uncharacterized RDD family membrane protein YckC
MPDERDWDQPELVTCDVTGETVPEDETVVIEGRRVSARGKQILLDRLGTGDRLDGEVEPPGNWRRLGCGILDSLIVGLFGAGIGAIMGFLLLNGSDDQIVRTSGGIELVGAVISVLYFALMHAASGQTLGKKLGRYKVVNLDGTDISGGTAFVRALMYVGVQGVPALIALFGGLGLYGLYEGLSMGVGIYVLVNLIAILVNKERRAIHDLVAGTKTVMNDD